MKNIRLGIAGLGTVAQGVLQIIADNGALISSRTGVSLHVTQIASRRERPGVDLLGAQFATDVAALASADDVDIVLELMGGEDTALTLIRDALAAGKPVVTANKAVVAAHGNELVRGQQRGQRAAPLRFEAAVAGAIPIIQAIQQGLVTNRFSQVVGIINGTCNYILTAMQEQGQSFDAALAVAQELGYAEADPAFDIEGVDAAHKLTILSALAFDAPFDFDRLHVEGITHITLDDIRYSAELGYRIKHVGIARRGSDGLEVRVHPALIAQDRLLANVNGVANAVVVDGDTSGQTLFSGPGAGGLATASAILADVLALARSDNEVAGNEGPEIETVNPTLAEPVFTDMQNIQCANYLRIPAQDEPGVFARVANALSSHGISIEAAIQKEPAAGQDVVPIVILTQVVTERAVLDALEQVRELPQVVGEIARIRVASV